MAIRQKLSGETLEPLLEARAIAEVSNMRRLLWPILASLAEIEDQKGDAAAELRAQARGIIDYIADHAGGERSELPSWPGPTCPGCGRQAAQTRED